MIKWEIGVEVLTAVSMKMAIFWLLAQCCLVEVVSVSEVLPVSIIALMMETTATSETLVNYYQTAWCYNL
jgi:hypothetical protein